MNLKQKVNPNNFVQSIIGRIKKDKACLAVFRRADNPSTEYQCWEYLAALNIDLGSSSERLPFATIAAAVAKEEPEENGSAGIGYAIAACYPEGKESLQAQAKLRRLLACDTLEEICQILRSHFSLIRSKSRSKLDFSRLLQQLLVFSNNNQTVKSQWAKDFYGRSAEEREEE